jgi:hypothetical protein
VKELASEVQHWLADEPVRAYREPVLKRAGRWSRRHRTLVAGAAAAAVVALAGLGVVLAVQSRANAELRRANERAETQRGIAEQNERTAKKNEVSARANELLARRRYYAGQMNLAMQAWETGQPARVLELLEDLRPRFDEEDLRTFEWYHLWGLGRRRQAHTLRGHSASVNTLAFSPDGRTLASGDRDGVAKLWDPSTGKEQSSLRAHNGGFWGLAFSADGKTLATGGGDLRLWDVSSRRERATFAASDYVRCLALSPDGKTLLYGTFAGESPRLVDIATGTERFTLPGRHKDGVIAVAFSPDGKTVATGYFPGLVKLWAWDGAAWRQKATIEGGGEMPLAFSPDNRLLALGGTSVRLWDVTAGRERATLRGPMSQGGLAIVVRDVADLAAALDAAAGPRDTGR